MSLDIESVFQFDPTKANNWLLSLSALSSSGSKLA